MNKDFLNRGDLETLALTSRFPSRIRRAARLVASVSAIAFVSACGTNIPVEQTYPDPGDIYAGQGSLLGGEGIQIFGPRRPATAEADGVGIGVNSYLWRASLDTISFMPLSQTPDPFGGVIVTDWYSLPDAPNERFKVNVFILSRELRADGVRVSVFRQVRDAMGNWVDAPVAANTEYDLENAILTRARQLRVATAQR